MFDVRSRTGEGGSTPNVQIVDLRLAQGHAIRNVSVPVVATESHEIEPGDEVGVRSRRGELVALAKVTASVAPGQLFIPMHFREVNRLTHDAVDPHSRQPSYKHCAVALSAKG